MNDFWTKLNKAADAVAEVLTEGVTSNQNVKLYTYDEFKEIVMYKRKVYPQIAKCTISVQSRKEFEDKVFPENKYVIRIVMLDEQRKPICVANNPDEYVGALVIADSIDKRLYEFMGDKTEKTVVIGGK